MRALDIGAGGGDFLMLLDEAGISAVGVEKDGDKISGNVQYGVFPYYLPDSINESKYGLISMNEVIYYLDVQESLEKAYRLLSDDGVLFIKYRNAENYESTQEHKYKELYGPDLVEAPIYLWIQDQMKWAGFTVLQFIPYPENNWTLLKCYLSLLIGLDLEREAHKANHSIIIGVKR